MANRFFLKLLSVFLIAFMASGCWTTRTEKRSQTIKVNTSPPGAKVWIGDESGQRVVGTSSLSLSENYIVGVGEFNRDWWYSFWGGLGLTLLGAFLYMLAEPIAGKDDEKMSIPGMIFLSVGGGITIPSAILCAIGESKREEILYTNPDRLKIGATLSGYATQEIEIKLPTDKKEINLLLTKTQAPAVAAAPVAAPAKGPDPKREIVAVFDIHDASRKLDNEVLVQLTVYLGTVLAQTGKYQVVPRDQLRKRLFEEKKGTYKSCYDESCQIELGKTLAAQKTLATTLIQIGTKCAVTANLFDLKNETAEKGASVETGCETEELLGAMKQIALQLSE